MILMNFTDFQKSHKENGKMLLKYEHEIYVYNIALYLSSFPIRWNFFYELLFHFFRYRFLFYENIRNCSPKYLLTLVYG